MPEWNIETQIHYPLITEVAAAPDGSAVAFCVREAWMDDEHSEFLTHIWLLKYADGEAMQLTFGEQSESGIAWSPDGRHIAFVTRHAERAELRVMRGGGGESWLLAALKDTAISSPRWSRDGSHLAFLAAAPPDEDLVRRRRARDDAYAWESDQPNARVYSVPFSIAPRQLPEPQVVSDGSFHVVGFDWLADGSGFALACMPSPIADYWPQTWLATMAIGSEPQRLGTIASWNPQPHVSPDGTQIACSTGFGAPRWATDNRVAVFATAGGEPRVLANTPDSQPDIVGWQPDGSGLVVMEYAQTGGQLFLLPSDGSTVKALHSAAMLSLPNANNGQIACVVEDFASVNTIATLDMATRQLHIRHTPALPTDWPAAPLPDAEILTWQSSDGMQIEGIVTYPLGYSAGQPVPLVVVVHGGPTGVYQRSYLGSPVGYAPICMLAEQGYATLRCNPRGSSGYGRDFRFANYSDWGGGDLQDILSGVDTLITRGVADPERLAMMGWSYGGFMTSWAITQTNRFKAACIGAPVTDPISFNGTADIPGFVPDYFGAEYWQDHDAYRRKSPLLHIQHVTTPALIQHGAADIRVPFSQGRQFYEGLRRRGIASQLIVYPRQGHLFSEPRLIIDCRNRVVAWLTKHVNAETLKH